MNDNPPTPVNTPVNTTAATATAPPRNPPRFLDADDLAAILKCSARHVHRLRDTGRIPQPVRLGALVRWPHHVITAWVAAGCPAQRRRK